jgi:acyl-CoA thioesterase-1
MPSRRSLLIPCLLLGCTGAVGRDPDAVPPALQEAHGASTPAQASFAADASVPAQRLPAKPRVVPPEPVMLHGRNLAKLPRKVSGVPRVLVIGDSVATGFGLAPGEPPYPTILAQRLAKEDGVAIEVLNGGINGFSTFGGIVLADLGSLQPDIVLIELGGNDFLLGRPIEGAQRNLRDMVAAGRGMGAQVLLVGVRLPDHMLGSDRGRAFDALYPALAEELGVPLVPDMYADALGVPRFMQRDGIHPTAEGQQVVADNVLPQLRPLVLSALGR